MSDANKNENNKNENNKIETNPNSNSLFLYTALIFIAAIIVILFAYFTQTHVDRAQPSPVPAEAESQAAPYDPDAPTDAPEQASEPQGIAKTAAQLSQDNMELLEENRELHNRVDELEDENDVYKPLIEAYYAKSKNNTERVKLLLEDIDYTTLTDEEKTLYDAIKSDLQQNTQ